jgi:hypothetical protein
LILAARNFQRMLPLRARYPKDVAGRSFAQECIWRNRQRPCSACSPNLLDKIALVTEKPPHFISRARLLAKQHSFYDEGL